MQNFNNIFLQIKFFNFRIENTKIKKNIYCQIERLIKQTKFFLIYKNSKIIYI